MKDLYHSSWDTIKLKRPPVLSVKFMLTKHHLSNHQTNAEVKKTLLHFNFSENRTKERKPANRKTDNCQGKKITITILLK